MSKIYALYGKDERKIDNLKKRIRSYEKMKKDLFKRVGDLKKENQRLKEQLQKQNQKYKEVMDKLKFIENRAKAGATQETINKLAITFVNGYLKEVE